MKKPPLSKLRLNPVSNTSPKNLNTFNDVVDSYISRLDTSHLTPMNQSENISSNI